MAAVVMIPAQQYQQPMQQQNNSPSGRDDSLADAPFKCIACRMIFENSEIQRNHYKLEFHRFNLKRKVAGLPPIQQEVFDKKITEIRSKQEESERPTTLGCKICNKQYSSENTLKQHLQSKKHLEQAGVAARTAKAAKQSLSARRVVNATKLAEQQKQQQEDEKQKSTTEESAADNKGKEEQKEEQNTPTSEVITSQKEGVEGEEGEVTKTPEQIMEEKIKLGLAVKLSPDYDCLFCRETSTGLKKNLKHMTTAHGLFVPDIEYLVDIKGLLSYLGEKIGLGNTCVYCNKTFSSAEAVRGHMSNLSHCKLLYDDRGAAEISDFYNFSSSYGDVQIDFTKSDNESEDDAEARLIDSLTKKAAAKLSEDGLELVLSDGRTIGHRSLSTYYKQKVRTPEVRESALIVNAMVNHYRALGWTTKASQTPSGMDPEVLKFQRRNQGEQMRLGVKANKLYVKRSQMGF